MNIYTDLIKNKQYSQPIQSELLKHSQEYRVLATLRYLFPQKYNGMAPGESPDLQDCEKDIGIEVTVAVRENDMKATSAFSKLHQANSDRDAEKYKRIIESSDHTLDPIFGEKFAMCAAGSSYGEKHVFQNSIRKKKAKLQQYRKHFRLLGLAIVLPDIPTSEAESKFVDWIFEVFQENGSLFDFVYVLSYRFCIYYDVQTNCSSKWLFSSEENKLLCTIARMTAEGELSLEDQEWKYPVTNKEYEF